MTKKFPYTARFDGCIVKASIEPELDKYLSKASLEDLKKLDIGSVVDLEKNIDLVGTVFNAAVINRLNRNDDGISTETALAIKDLFVHKPHNLEHKSNRIVGHIVKAGWSSFGGNQILSDDEVKGMTEPFNLTLGGVVYRLVDEKFAEMLVEASDESSSKYLSISTSWELGFTEFHIVLGSKNLNEAEIISDPEQIKELKKYLKAFGGPGKLPDGRYIGRLIVGEVGDVLPVGMAFTSKPAAEVSGVSTTDWVDLLTPEEKAQLVEQSEASTQNNQENCSQINETDVKNISQAETITMPKITNIKELLAAASSKDGLSEANVTEFIASQIEAKSKEWEIAQNAKANETKAVAERATKLETELAKANEQLTKVSEALDSMQKESVAKKKEEDFQTRMSAIASEFELSTKESELIAKQIRTLDEVAYASWFENFSVFAESKKKTSIAAAKEKTEAEIAEAKKVALASVAAPVVVTQTPAEIAKASEAAAAELATAALEKAKETPNQSVANTQAPVETTDPKKEWSDAFGGQNLKISV